MVSGHKDPKGNFIPHNDRRKVKDWNGNTGTEIGGKKVVSDKTLVDSLDANKLKENKKEWCDKKSHSEQSEILHPKGIPFQGTAHVQGNYHDAYDKENGFKSITERLIPVSDMGKWEDAYPNIELFGTFNGEPTVDFFDGEGKKLDTESPHWSNEGDKIKFFRLNKHGLQKIENN
jgi:hypothetical protein